MKSIKCIIILILFVQCSSKSEINNEINLPLTISDTITSQSSTVSKDNCIYDLDTLKIGVENFYVFQNMEDNECDIKLTILNHLLDTVYSHFDYATAGFQFEDFTGNGILDIRVHQMTNIGGVSQLIVFDQKNNSFNNIKAFDNYPEPNKIKNTNFYYSYHRSGCSDFNWGSELFIIENFEVVQLGYIEGIGCEDEERNGIFVFNNIGTKKIEVHSELRAPGFYGDKWEFIENYWKKNYKAFQ